jgi:outer membrane protein
MMGTAAFRCWSGVFLILGFWIISAGCSMVAKRIDTIAGWPGEPAETAVTMATEQVAKAEESAGPPATKGAIRITTGEAILLSLENNRALLVERLSPTIEQTFEDQARAEFDPLSSAEITAARAKAESQSRSTGGTDSFDTDDIVGEISLEQFFPTGTTVAVGATGRMTDSSLFDNNFYSTRLGMSITQALLQGYGTDVNLVQLRQARLGTRFSEYELRGFAETLVAEVENTYWDYALARRQIEIFEESLKLARQQLRETEEIVRVGRLAEAELPAVQAEVAAQEQGLINARSSAESTRLQLLRLLNPPGPDLWDRPVELIYQPTLPEIKLGDVQEYVAVSMRMRPDLNQARLGVLRDDLELVKTKNGLLPKMDLFITLGKTGYSDSFGGSVRDISGDHYDALAGARFEYPLWNRDAKARHQRALLSRDQADKALSNLTQLVELDVHRLHRSQPRQAADQRFCRYPQI